MIRQPQPDDVTQLRAAVMTLQADVARLRGRQHNRNRLLPLAFVGLLVALLPLSLFAAVPFTDLDPTQDGPTGHNPNVELLYDAGITKGCTPTEYCPTATVTRQEMATFLARTAGLGTNAPVTNAKTLQGRTSAEFLASSGDMTLRSTFFAARPDTIAAIPLTLNPGSAGALRVTSTSTGDGYLYVPIDRPASMFGVNLAVKSVTICYAVSGGAALTNTALYHTANAAAPIANDPTDRTSTVNACYTIAPPTVAAYGGALYLYLGLNFTATTQAITLRSIALTLAPTTAAELALPAGTGEEDGEGPGR